MKMARRQLAVLVKSPLIVQLAFAAFADAEQRVIFDNRQGLRPHRQAPCEAAFFGVKEADAARPLDHHISQGRGQQQRHYANEQDSPARTGVGHAGQRDR